MNEVTRPYRPLGSISCVAATFAALCVLLAFASVASAASEPLTGGTTTLNVKKGFKKKLGKNNVKLLKQGSGKVKKRTVQLGVTGGAIDTDAAQGSIEHAGGFKLKHRKRTAPVTQVRIDLSGRAVFAKVAGAKMKLGSLAKISYARNGLAVDVSSAKLKLTGKAARRLNRKLGIGKAIKGGRAISNARSAAQLAAAAPVPAPDKGGEAGPPAPVAAVVKTMTRNLYLGADLGPAITAPSEGAFVAATGKVLRDVTHNDFPTRAEGLAAEILEKEPDLVGLQEVALWRTAPVNPAVLVTGPSATTVRYDYLAELMAELNAGGPQYEVAVVQNEFDLEAPADEDETGPPEINGRLTMRDVILSRVGAGVTTSNPQGGNFKDLLVIPILGKYPLAIKRGWTSVDATVRGSRSFHFVNTHFEAFHPIVRAEQAEELVGPGGPLINPDPVVLVGDLNTDDDTGEPGPGASNRLAYTVLHVGGMVERSTDEPLSCCLKENEGLIAEGDGGAEGDFDHQVDHIMTRDPKDVLLVGSSVSGIAPVNGFWDSDHAGLSSSLEILP